MATFGPGDAGKWKQRAAQAIKRATRRAVTMTADRVVTEIQAAIIPSFPEKERPVDRGTYLKGWRSRRTERGALIYNVTIGGYGPMIEFGVRKERVKISKKMLDALEEWVKRKGIGGTVHVSKSGKVTRRPAPELERRQIALAIARKMKGRGIFNRNGQHGLGVLAKAKKRIPQFMREAFHAAMAEEKA